MQNTVGIRRAVLLVVVAALALVAVYQIAAARNEYEPTAQDAVRLESRINQLEQRLYTIETSVRTLEQQSRVGAVSSRNVTPEEIEAVRAQLQSFEQSRNVTPEEIEAVRAQLQSFELRFIDDECAIAKLDERTLSAAQRQARIRSAARTEPCRLSADTPVRLPERR